MRELLLGIIVAGICAKSLISPVTGLYGYIWYALMRPDFLAWSHRPVFSLAIAVCTFLGLLRHVYLVPRIFVNPVVLLLLALQIPIALSVPFAIEPALSVRHYELYRRVILMSLLVPVLIRTEEEIKWLVVLMALSLGVLGSKYGLFGIINGGVRFNDGPGGFLSDNNCFALALAMAVPLLWHARQLWPGRIQKMFITTCGILTVAAAVMTFSRGAAISLAAVFLVLTRQSERKIGALIMLAAIIALPVYLVQDAYLDRLATLQNPEQEGSANARIRYAKFAMEVARDYPLLGVGFGTRNQMRIQAQYLNITDPASQQVVHNTYLQMLTDSGVFAFGLYFILLFGTIWWLGRSAKQMRRVDPTLAHVPMALQASLIAFAVGSTFLSRVNFDLTYYLLMAAAAWLPVERQRFQRAEEEAAAAPTPFSAEAVAV